MNNNQNKAMQCVCACGACVRACMSVSAGARAVLVAPYIWCVFVRIAYVIYAYITLCI